MLRIISAIAFISVMSIGCRSYKQDIMFRLDDDFTEDDLAALTDDLVGNYQIMENDVFNMDIFTNKGERLLDPNFELAAIGGAGAQQNAQFRDRFSYTVQSDGTVDLPLIGNYKVLGQTQFEAERMLSEKYNDIYKDTFVKLRMSNRRAFVLGAPGGVVVPLQNEQTTIFEVLAIAQGIQFGAKAHNIKLIRGDAVFMIDLSTISGMKKSQLNVEPGDVIYVEPWRRPWIESLRDATPTISLLASIVTLTFLIVDNASQDASQQ